MSSSTSGGTGSVVQARVWLQAGFWILLALILIVATGLRFGEAVVISILAVTITKATPLTLGALAGITSERSGVVNIAIEGLMLTSAFVGFMVGVYTQNLGMAVIAALVGGALMSLLHAVLSITFRVDQIISSNQNLYFRYGYQKTDNAVTSPLPPDAGGNYYAGGGNDVSTSQSWVFVHNKIWSPTLISSVRSRSPWPSDSHSCP